MQKLETEKVVPTIPWMNIKVYKSKLPKGVMGKSFHMHREIELMYVIKGCVEWTFEGESYRACEKDLVFVSDFYPHSTCAITDSVYLLVQFPKDKLFATDLNINNKLYSFMHKPNKNYHFYKNGDENSVDIIKHIKTIDENYQKKNKYNQMFVCAACINIMGELMKDGLQDSNEFDNIQTPQIKKIIPITDFIEKNYHRPLYLKDISAELGFNSVYLCRIFKKATGKTITDYINYIRIQNCLELLKTKDLNITEIGLSCGFSNIPHFNSIFKKQMGCSPGEYRKSQM